MPSPVFLTRVVLRNYKSIAACDVRLGPLTYLLGPNGSGKSNFLDALHLVADALNGSLDHALNQRGGLSEVRRRSSGRPTNFGIRLGFRLPDERPGFYAFMVGALKGGGYEVQDEQCAIGWEGRGLGFKLQRGKLVATSEESFPAVTSDRLGLVAASGLPAFRPVFDALTAMGFYNLDPKLMRELQKPQEGRLLKPSGENIASVVRHLARAAPEALSLVSEYLHAVAPMVQGVEHKSLGPMETLEFRQDVAGAEYPWRFPAQGMSDGTLRVLGTLVAMFQGVSDSSVRLVGIEEPETALHPAAFAALREALQQASEQTQVLVTSHSPDLLDDSALMPAALLAVVSEGGESRIARVDAASRQMLEEHLFTAGELLRLNQLGPERVAAPGQPLRSAELFEALSPLDQPPPDLDFGMSDLYL
ncbi:AAA family ATPase [uncultured Thiodictyon sp.]|uniref:AAA family ATPase n=1 Tax=uncultured Thiodictyon sp. TaxID=1846217 RepID=UPI0025EB2557|nr:AAA family ATPase [uncultured Thiodictyon sp.]